MIWLITKANLKTSDTTILRKLLLMDEYSGNILNFTDNGMRYFFKNDCGIDIDDQKYCSDSASQIGRVVTLWRIEDDAIVGGVILNLIEYIESQIAVGNLHKEGEYGFPRIPAIDNHIIEKGNKIARRLLGENNTIFENRHMTITLHEEVFTHVQELLNNGHYYNAVEEAYKIVRAKLMDMTGTDKAHEAFNKSNYEKIFGHPPHDNTEKDFFEGVKFLHMAIQQLRNEKSHTPACYIDENIALHYIALASLGYYLITK